jgi:hypothetical protein
MHGGALFLIGRQDRAWLDDLSRFDAHFGDGACVRCGDLIFHLHRFDDEEDLARLDGLARCGAHGHDGALQ